MNTPEQNLGDLLDTDKQIRDAMKDVVSLMDASGETAKGQKPSGEAGLVGQLKQVFAPQKESKGPAQNQAEETTFLGKLKEVFFPSQENRQKGFLDRTVEAFAGDVPKPPSPIQQQQQKAMESARAKMDAAEKEHDTAQKGVDAAKANFAKVQSEGGDTMEAWESYQKAQGRADKAGANLPQVKQAMVEAQAGMQNQEADKKKPDAAQTAMLAARAAEGDPTAIAQLAQNKLQETKDMVKHGAAAGSEFGKAVFGSDTVGEMGSHAFGGVEEAGKAIGGPVGDVVEGLGKFGKMLSESLDNLRKWDRQLMEANFRFAEFSGAMATIQGQQEMRDIMRQQTQGNARAGSTRDLAEAYSDLENALSPMENSLANIRNDMAAGITTIVTKLVPLLAPIGFILDKTDKILAWLVGREKDEQQKGLRDTILGQEDDWAKKHGKAPRF